MTKKLLHTLKFIERTVSLQASERHRGTRSNLCASLKSVSLFNYLQKISFIIYLSTI